MKKNVLLLGGCCIDETLHCNTLPQSGDDILIQSKQVQLGGSCLNVATTLKRCHKNPILYSALGNNIFTQYRNNLIDEGFDTQCIFDIDGQTGTCTILVDSSKERTFLTYRGIEGTFIENIISDECVQSYDWVYLSGIYLVYGDESQKIVPFLMRMIHQGKKIFFDLGSLVDQIEINLLGECLSLSNIIKGNEAELTQLKKRFGLQSESELLNSHLSIVIKTLGKDGSITYLPDGPIVKPSVEVIAEDTTGSGDAFVGAFLSALCDELPIEQCLELASQHGALTTTHPGGRIKLK